MDYYAKAAENILARVGWKDILEHDTQRANNLVGWAKRCIPTPLKVLEVGGQEISQPARLREVVRD